jgi:hypothetical protein
MLSPDGKWVVYSSDESGRAEIYGVPFPGSGGKWRISNAGGITSYWPIGQQLFYSSPDAHIISVELETEGTNLRVGKSRAIFGGRALGSSIGFHGTADGRRWLVAMPVPELNASPLILTTNWTAGLQK